MRIKTNTLGMLSLALTLACPSGIAFSEKSPTHSQATTTTSSKSSKQSSTDSTGSLSTSSIIALGVGGAALIAGGTGAAIAANTIGNSLTQQSLTAGVANLLNTQINSFLTAESPEDFSTDLEELIPD